MKKPLKIEFAPDIEIEKYQDIADDFMRRVFDMEPQDYMISDESALGDFRGCIDGLDTTDDIKAKVQALYNIDTTSTYLVDLFKQIT